MAISGISGGANWGTSAFQRANREIIQYGQRWAADISRQDNSYANVSNFGHLTGKIASIGSSYSEVSKLGKGEFSHVTRQIFSDGSGGMKKGADGIRAYVDTLNYRSQNGSSQFQKANEFVSLRYLQDA